MNCMLGTPFLWSQDDYFPFIEQGKEWNFIAYQSDGLGKTTEYEYKYKINGDTIINQVKYAKIYMIDYRYNSTELSAFVREKDKKVYQYAPWSENETLIYDFDIKVNDSICICNGNWQLILKNVSTINTESGQRKCFYFESYAYNSFESSWEYTYAYPIYIIEGIGSTFSPVYFTPEYMMSSRYLDKLVFCSVNDRCIYKIDNFQDYITSINLMPVKLDSVKKERLYDLSGRMLKDLPEHGVYIMNGKKIMK